MECGRRWQKRPGTLGYSEKAGVERGEEESAAERKVREVAMFRAVADGLAGKGRLARKGVGCECGMY